MNLSNMKVFTILANKNREIQIINTSAVLCNIQGVPLILVQTLREGRGHEDEHY